MGDDVNGQKKNRSLGFSDWRLKYVSASSNRLSAFNECVHSILVR